MKTIALAYAYACALACTNALAPTLVGAAALAPLARAGDQPLTGDQPLARAVDRPAPTLLTGTLGSAGGWYASSAGAENLIDPTRLADATFGADFAAVTPRGLAWTGGAGFGRTSRTTTRQLGTETFDILVHTRSWNAWSGVAQYWPLGDGVWVFAGPQLGVWSGRLTTQNGLADATHHPRSVWFTLGARLGVMMPVGRRLWLSASAGHTTGFVHAAEGRYDSAWWASDTHAEFGLGWDVSARSAGGRLGRP